MKIIKKGISIFNVGNPQKGTLLANSILSKTVDKKTVLFLSGGSTPKSLYELIAKKGRLFFGAVAVIDERFGEKMHKNSNERMIGETGFLSYLEENKIPFYPILRLHPKRALDIARNYDKEVKNLLENFSKSIAVMGIGEDGHTASLAAGSQNSSLRQGFGRQAKLKTQNYVKSVSDFPGEFKERITLTFKALSKMDLLIVLAFGSAKQNALVLMFKEGTLSEIPARFFVKPEIAKKTILITDQTV